MQTKQKKTSSRCHSSLPCSNKHPDEGINRKKNDTAKKNSVVSFLDNILPLRENIDEMAMSETEQFIYTPKFVPLVWSVCHVQSLSKIAAKNFTSCKYCGATAHKKCLDKDGCSNDECTDKQFDLAENDYEILDEPVKVKSAVQIRLSKK